MTSEIKRRGLMLVLSSPSGAGKTTLSRALLEADRNISLSVSATTRPMRPGEIHGTDYFFLSDEKFDEWLRQDRFLEHATVYGNRYGTPEDLVHGALSNGQDVLFDIDWQGTQQLKDKLPDDVVSIFILPPSHAELERRLKNRAQDHKDVVEARMAKAASEMSHYDEYTYIVVNENTQVALATIQAVLNAERARRTRLVGVGEFVAGLTR
ncbi:MAG TPA: guanylate kinase [Rhizomicrobium sp.]|nr:guanylate kinase [Rhizomicrobium sp.]